MPDFVVLRADRCRIGLGPGGRRDRRRRRPDLDNPSRDRLGRRPLCGRRRRNGCVPRGHSDPARQVPHLLPGGRVLWPRRLHAERPDRDRQPECRQSRTCSLTFAAIAIGGTSFSGGRGGLIGAMIGAATLTLLQKVLFSAGVSSFYTGIFQGAGDDPGGADRSPFRAVRPRGTRMTPLPAEERIKAAARLQPAEAAREPDTRDSRRVGLGGELWTAIALFGLTVLLIFASRLDQPGFRRLERGEGHPRPVILRHRRGIRPADGDPGRRARSVRRPPS